MSDRVVTFSIKPEDTKGLENISELRKQSKETGVSFSYLILAAIQKGKDEEK